MITFISRGGIINESLKTLCYQFLSVAILRYCVLLNIEHYILKQSHDILLLKISYANHHQFTSIGVRIPSSFIILPKALGGPSANPSYGVIKSSNHPGLALRLPCLSFSVENFLRNSVPSIKY